GVLQSARAGSTRFDRTFREALVRPGPGGGNWVSRTNYPACGIVQTGPAEMSLYVQRHYGLKTAHLERLTLRLDGFASVHAPFAGGELLTRPLRFAGNALELNWSTSATGRHGARCHCLSPSVSAALFGIATEQLLASRTRWEVELSLEGWGWPQ